MSASAARTKRKRPSSTIVMATVPIAVTCMPVLREKLRSTSPRKNLTLPQSKIIVAPLFIGSNASVLQPNDATAHAIHDGLIVRRNDDRRSLEIDPLQQ